MVEISVIMPVYNAEQYLPDAIRSVLNQTFSDFELILVDDGSQDASGAVCDQFAADEARIHTVHQENGGICAARNRGLQESSGRFVMFIDNDDTYYPDLLEKVRAFALETGAPVVKYGYHVRETFADGSEQHRDSVSQTAVLLEKQDFASHFLELRKAGFFNMIWNGLYDRAFLENNGLYFDESIRYGYEDWIFNFQLLGCLPRLAMLPYTGYLHEQRNGVSTSKKFYINRPYNCIASALVERTIFDSLNLDSLYPTLWATRLAEYIIEVLTLFQLEGCRMNIPQRAAFMREMAGKPPFDRTISRQEAGGLPRTKRLVLRLFFAGRMKRLCRLGGLYYHYAVYKRKHGK